MTAPKQAYEVEVGLDITMSSDDLAGGLLRVLIKVALQNPAEFVHLTIEQKVEKV